MSLIKIGAIKKCGVYGIKDILGTVLYVGSAKECNDSYSRHKSNLKNGSYKNNNKNVLADKSEKEDLFFYIIEECAEAELDDKETKYIEMYEDTICNNNKVGKRRHSRPTPQETEKRRQVNLGNCNPNCQTEIELVIQIKKLIADGYSNKEIAEMADINKSATYVSRIRTGNRWASVEVVA